MAFLFEPTERAKKRYEKGRSRWKMVETSRSFELGQLMSTINTKDIYDLKFSKLNLYLIFCSKKSSCKKCLKSKEIRKKPRN